MVKHLVLLCFISSVLLSCMEHAAPVTEQHALSSNIPLLHIQPETYVLGDIKEGEAAIATFIIRNNNAKPVELVDIQAACGCTAAEPDSYNIMPGSFTQLKVAVDTTAKQWGIKKEVYVTDSLGNKASATLTFNVIENPHQMKEGKVKGIFDGQCASCHFEPLKNVKESSELYAVGCAMCHGENAEGGYAPGLRGIASAASLKHSIAHGVGKPQMPGFAAINGGPLSYEQIKGLAAWLQALPEE